MKLDIIVVRICENCIKAVPSRDFGFFLVYAAAMFLNHSEGFLNIFHIYGSESVDVSME